MLKPIVLTLLFLSQPSFSDNLDQTSVQDSQFEKMYDLLLTVDLNKLVSSGLDLYVKNEEGLGLLHEAVRREDLETIKRIFEIINILIKDPVAKHDFINLRAGPKKKQAPSCGCSNWEH